jgi:polysaccharide biosynthesis protein PelF
MSGRGGAAARKDRGAGEGRSTRPRVAMLTEGTYPFVRGGVSTWCDQLVRGLSEEDFEIVAVVAAPGSPTVWDLPDNVVAVTSVALWGFVAEERSPHGERLRQFRAALEPFLASLLDPTIDDTVFDESLRALFEYAQEHPLTAAIMSDDAAETLGEVWGKTQTGRISVFEAMKALELLEHNLRPLSAPVVHADLCHATSNGLPSLLAVLAKWRYGTPYIMSEHGVYLRERYLAFQRFDTPWSVKFLVLSFFRRLTRLAYQEASVIAPVNVYNQRWEVEHGADPDVIVTALNGVNADDYPAMTDEPPHDVVVWVGRVDPLKDLETLVEGFARLLRRVPTATLDLYGPVPMGNEWYLRRIRNLIERRKLRSRVRFMGPISPVSTAYQRARVVVLSSISEGLPYTVIEAMMSGRATVSTDVGGVREVVADAGLLVPPRDPKALAAALETILTDDELRADFAMRASERGRTYFRLERMLSTFRAEYARLIDPQSPQFTSWTNDEWAALGEAAGGVGERDATGLVPTQMDPESTFTAAEGGAA